MQELSGALEKMFPFTLVGQEECEECGTIYKLYETPKGVQGACKPCTDRKTIKEFNIPTVEEYRRSKDMNFILSFERVTGDLKGVTVNSYKPRHETQMQAKQKVIEFVKQFTNTDRTHSMVLSGAPGLGKSHLAYAINKAIRQQGFKTLFIKTTDLLDHIKSTYSNYSKITDERIFKMIDGLDLLVLDDVGSEYVKGNENGHESWASDVLYKVFDIRLDKSIVCTTNYTESELTAKYGNNGPRIISRMMDKATGIRLEGEDYRIGRDRF